jgi:hypothetical protein
MKIIILSISLILILGLNAFAQSDDFFIGKSQGEQMAKGNPLWLAGGLGCGCFGIGFAYLSKPSLDYNMLNMLENKSEAYKAGFTQGYQNKSRNTNIVYASIGWLAWLVILASISNSTSY